MGEEAHKTKKYSGLFLQNSLPTSYIAHIIDMLPFFLYLAYLLKTAGLRGASGCFQMILRICNFVCTICNAVAKLLKLL